MVETEFSEQQEKFKKMHCTKTRETELIPESSVSLSLLDFQNYFKGRLRKKLVTQSSQFIELFSQWNCVLLYESAGFFCNYQPGTLWCLEENRSLFVLTKFHNLSTERQLWVKHSVILLETTIFLWQERQKFGKIFTLNWNINLRFSSIKDNHKKNVDLNLVKNGIKDTEQAAKNSWSPVLLEDENKIQGKGLKSTRRSENKFFILGHFWSNAARCWFVKQASVCPFIIFEQWLTQRVFFGIC